QLHYSAIVLFAHLDKGGTHLQDRVELRAGVVGFVFQQVEIADPVTGLAQSPLVIDVTRVCTRDFIVKFSALLQVGPRRGQAAGVQVRLAREVENVGQVDFGLSVGRLCGD